LNRNIEETLNNGLNSRRLHTLKKKDSSNLQFFDLPAPFLLTHFTFIFHFLKKMNGVIKFLFVYVGHFGTKDQLNLKKNQIDIKILVNCPILSALIDG